MHVPAVDVQTGGQATEAKLTAKPLLLGGGMVDEGGEGNAPSRWSDGPARFEAGSPNLPGAAGFAAAAGLDWSAASLGATPAGFASPAAAFSW